MGVGTSESERVDRGPKRVAVAGRKVQVLDDHVQIQRLEIHRGIRVREVEAGWQVPVVQAERGLYQSGDAGGGFEVTDIGFHRTDVERVVGRMGRAQGVTERIGFDRVTDSSAGAVRLDEVDLIGGDTGQLAGVQDEALLGLAVGHHHGGRVAILVHRRGPHTGVDSVVVSQRGLQWLDDDGADAFTADEAVC